MGTHPCRAPLRLLIDEMYPHVIAEQLRARGFDVLAVSERKEWRSMADPAIFDLCQSEGRAIVTENIGDYVAIAGVVEQRGVEHFGLILIDPAKFPRGNSATIGNLVRALADLLTERPEMQARSLRHWL